MKLKKLKQKDSLKKTKQGWGYSSVVDCLLSMNKALGSVSITKKQKQVQFLATFHVPTPHPPLPPEHLSRTSKVLGSIPNTHTHAHTHTHTHTHTHREREREREPKFLILL